MIARRFQRGQILIIYLTSLFVGGSSLALGVLSTGKSLDELVESVEAHVATADRQQTVLKLLDRWQTEGEQQQEAYRDRRERLLELIEDHAASRAQFDDEIDRLLAMDAANTKRLLDIQDSLRKDLNEAEWKLVFAR